MFQNLWERISNNQEQQLTKLNSKQWQSSLASRAATRNDSHSWEVQIRVKGLWARQWFQNASTFTRGVSRGLGSHISTWVLGPSGLALETMEMAARQKMATGEAPAHGLLCAGPCHCFRAAVANRWSAVREVHEVVDRWFRGLFKAF